MSLRQKKMPINLYLYFRLQNHFFLIISKLRNKIFVPFFHLLRNEVLRLFLSARFGTAVFEPDLRKHLISNGKGLRGADLHSGLGQIDPCGHILARENVGVTRLLKRRLQNVQLSPREGGTLAALFSSQIFGKFSIN